MVVSPIVGDDLISSVSILNAASMAMETGAVGRAARRSKTMDYVSSCDG